MKTIKSLKDITTLEVDDVVLFGNLEYKVAQIHGYYLSLQNENKNKVNNEIFKVLNISNRDFVKNLGIDILPTGGLFPEVRSLEALTAIVSALFKEYEKQNNLPKTWEEFCDKYPVSNNEAVISDNSDILIFDELPNTFTERDPDVDRNFCTSLKEAEAFLALMQLRQLRKAYIGDWEPDWNCSLSKFCIIVDVNKIRVSDYCFVQKSLSFPTSNLAQQFLTNFKDLLEIAKPLL